MTLKILNEILKELMLKDLDFYPLHRIVEDMYETGDSNISFSCDNIGINITKNAIDIVDIFAGESIATLELKLSKQTNQN